MEAYFFYNTTTQRPDPNKRRPDCTNISINSSALPVKSFSASSLFSPKSIARTSTDLSQHASHSTSGSSRSEQESVKPRGKRYSYTRFESGRRTSIAREAKSDHKRGKSHSDRMSSSISQGLAPFYSRSRTSRSQASDGTALRKTNTGVSQFAGAPGVVRLNGAVLNTRNGLSRTLSRDDLAGNSATSSLNEQQASREALHMSYNRMPFVTRHGRRYLRETSGLYPLPCDLQEHHRQTLRTMLLVQLLGSPVCSPTFDTKPPKDVLELGCGTGYWSSLCHQHFARAGHSVSFTGVDLANMAPDMGKDGSMKWNFIQADFSAGRLPFDDESFDLIMSKDMSLCLPETDQAATEEYFRILRPGGILEIWDSDHLLRTLVDPSPQLQAQAGHRKQVENEAEAQALLTGTYTVTSSTSFAGAQNEYLLDYNAWMTKAMQARKLTLVPCTHIGHYLMSEGDRIQKTGSTRLAIPLGDIRWEREGVGVEVGNDGNGAENVDEPKASRRILTPLQAALRRTALLTFIQSIESLEPILREASGKNQDEWDRWASEMTNDLLDCNGTEWGECLEFGAWWAMKKEAKPQVLKKPSLTVAMANRGNLASSSDSRSPMTSSARRVEASLSLGK